MSFRRAALGSDGEISSAGCTSWEIWRAAWTEEISRLPGPIRVKQQFRRPGARNDKGEIGRTDAFHTRLTPGTQVGPPPREPQQTDH